MLEEDNLITNREVIHAVKNQMINVPPPKQGRNETLPSKAFGLLCDLLFSHDAISQHDGDEILKRKNLVCILDIIAGDYLEERGKGNMNGSKLFQQVLKQNSLHQEVDLEDICEIIRYLWFTQKNLLMNYDGFEKMAVKLGFC